MAKEKETAFSANRSALVKMHEASSVELVETMDASWMEGVQVERVVILEDGKGIKGKFLGEGPPCEVADPVTGDMRPLKTWRIEIKPNIVARLLGSARLNSEFSCPSEMEEHPRLGQRVRVGRIGKVESKRGRQVTDYFVAWEM